MIRRRREAVQLFNNEFQPTPATFGNTIVSVPHREALKSLCIEESDTVQPQIAPSQRLFKIRLVDNEGHRQAASLLVKRRYAWRGYQAGGAHLAQPNRITLSASADEDTVATISVGLDSDAGLFVDKLYGDDVDRIRSHDRKVCEFTKLAIEFSIRSKPVLAALFHIAYIHARRINRCTDLVVEVNPRHAAFYKHMLGFEECGGEKIDPRVGAPAVLLRLDLAFAERQIAELGGHLELARNKRSLYPYFFARAEESAIERRLRTVG
jgi:hypothetical protein